MINDFSFSLEENVHFEMAKKKIMSFFYRLVLVFIVLLRNLYICTSKGYFLCLRLDDRPLSFDVAAVPGNVYFRKHACIMYWWA